MKINEENRMLQRVELSDDDLSGVVGGITIPELLDKFEEFKYSLIPPVTADELGVFERVEDSLRIQGLKAAKALSKRLVKPYPRLSYISDIIPSD